MTAAKETHAERSSISLAPDLLDAFDRFRKERRYPTRSEANRDLIRERLVQFTPLASRTAPGTVPR